MAEEKLMIHFTIRVPHGTNFTAASLMHRYAAENHLQHGYYKGRSVITAKNGEQYGFDHWEIISSGAEDLVTVYLFICAHLMK